MSPKSERIAPVPLCPTGLEGLDDILPGGLPANRFYLVRGEPGSGKTTLALQFLLEGIRRGEKCLYITLSETKQEVVEVANSHGWSLEGLAIFEMTAVEVMLKAESQTTVFHPSEVELNLVTRMLEEEAERVRPTRLVLDSISEFKLLAETPLRYRRQLLHFKQIFLTMNCTVLLLDDSVEANTDPHIQSITHGVIELMQRAPEYGAARRRVRITKCRGVKFRGGYHDFIIKRGGLEIFPRLIAAEHRGTFQRESISSGVKELDAIMGGGIDRATTSLLLGPAGTGKSTLATLFAWRIAQRGEKAMIFAFDETYGLFMARAKAMGMDLEPYVASGLIHIQQVDPAELSPGEFAAIIRRGVENGVKLVTVDSLNGYMNAMPNEQFLNIQLHELCAYLNQQGVATLLILALHGLVGQNEAPVDLSYLADMVVSLRYFEANGAIRQVIAVIKKRSGAHEKTVRQFKLEPGGGLQLGAPLTEFDGVLTGRPIFHGGTDKMIGGK